MIQGIIPEKFQHRDAAQLMTYTGSKFLFNIMMALLYTL